MPLQQSKKKTQTKLNYTSKKDVNSIEGPFTRLNKRKRILENKEVGKDQTVNLKPFDDKKPGSSHEITTTTIAEMAQQLLDFKKDKDIAAVKKHKPSCMTLNDLRDEERKKGIIYTLHQFDLNMKFGPWIGMSRLERWQRAEKHKKNPPKEVLTLLETFTEDPQVQEQLWAKEL